MWRLLRRTYRRYRADRVHLFASAASFYALISLAPILVISITIARWILGEESAREQIIDQFTAWWGEDARNFLVQAYLRLRGATGGVWPTVASVVVIFWGATRTFVALSASLDAIWEAEPVSTYRWKRRILDRLAAFLIAMGAGLLLVALALFSMGLSILRPHLGDHMFFDPAFQVIYWIGSCVGVAILCAAIYRVLPHVDIEWRHVWIGALVTAVLLNAARALIGWYLTVAGTRSIYGAAGAVMVIMIWVYYSAQFFFMGAEFTYVHARWSHVSHAQNESHRDRLKGGGP